MTPLESTHPAFQEDIQRIALVAKLEPGAVHSLWRQYSNRCGDCDQSPDMGEFVVWFKAQLGGDETALIDAIIGEPTQHARP